MKSNTKNLGIVAVLIVLYFIAAKQINYSLISFVASIPGFFSFLFQEFFSPNIASLPKYIQPILGTVSVAIIASIIGSMIAFVLSLLVSNVSGPSRIIGSLLRIVLTFFRNIPMLIWATLFTIVVGIGSTAGILALILFTLTFLTRNFADAIDGSDIGTLEAMEALGASKLCILRYGVISSFVPTFYSWLLFIIEINIKASSILGLVGAGGLGYELKKNLDLFNYREVSALIIVIVGMLLLIEIISNGIRKVLI